MVNEIRTSFLIEFTKQLAKNYVKINKKELVEENLETAQSRGQIAEVQEIEHTEYEKLGPIEIKSIREIEPYDPNARRIQTLGLNPSLRINDKIEPILQESRELKPLREFLSDPTIDNIECSGPDKNVVIKQKGKIVETQLQLKKEEIDSIIKAFSSRSSIKPEEGILKTKVENLKIIVVDSKFAGSRFVITKST